MFEWIQAHKALLFWLGGISFFLFIGTLIVIPIMVAEIPADYFKRRHIRDETKRIYKEKLPFLRLITKFFKNLLGVIFVLAGIAMLLLPGQGLITIFIGIMLIDFPGKHKLEEKIIQKPAILRPINWMRNRAHKPPLEFIEALPKDKV